MTTHVLVVGDIVTDVVAVVGGPIAHASDTGAEIAVTGGGAGANTSAWLAAAGARVTLCGVVGADDTGRARLAELAAHGVACAVRSAGEARTGSVVVIAERSERTMLTDRGANLLLSPTDIDRAFDGSPAGHLHLSGYPLLDDASRPAARHALRAAAARGMTTSVDAASAGPLRRVGGSIFLSWVRGTDVLFANVDEARALLGRDGSPMELARALVGVARIAVVKAGGDGAVVATEAGVLVAPAVPARIIDATGAGDAFAAGFLAAWLAGGSATSPAEAMLAEALVEGTRWGARAVAMVGGRPPAGASGIGVDGPAGAV